MAQVDAELGWSAQGDPVDVPANAVGWRVRRCHPRGGALERVNTADQSGPLVVSIECSHAGFVEAVGHVGGKYRLDAVDERGAIIGPQPAYVTVGGASIASSGGVTADEALAKSLETIERLAKTNAETMERITTNLSAQLSTMVTAAAKLIEAADNAGITTRERAQLVAAAEAKADEEKPAPVLDPNKPSPWEPVIEAITPALPQLLELGVKFAALKLMTPAATPPAAGAAAAAAKVAGAANGAH